MLTWCITCSSSTTTTSVSLDGTGRQVSARRSTDRATHRYRCALQSSTIVSHTDLAALYLATRPQQLASTLAVYHWIGETFIGAWRVWDNLFVKLGVDLPIPDPDRIIFLNVDDRMYDAEDESTWEGGWRDRQGLNWWYTTKLL